MRRTTQRGFLLSSLIIVATLLGSVGCGGGDSNNAAGGGDPELVGNWSGSEPSDPTTVWTFSIGATTAEVKTSDIEAYKGTYTADPTSDPKRLTIKITDCFYASYIGKTTNSIYKIEGTTLTLAGNEPGNAAVPTAFVEAGNTRLFVLTRQ